MKYFVLILTVSLALMLRFYQLGSIPVSLYQDEAAIGYNAYSIEKTGRDEYGQLFPLLFRSFDDYKFPGYIYMVSFSIKLFGLNEFSVRFPSALLGGLLALAVYKSTSAIIDTFLLNFLRKVKSKVALLAALLIAISPWSIQFSRAGFEANGGLFFVTLGIVSLLLSVTRLNIRNLYLSAFFFVISLYFYRSELIFVPAIILTMAIIFKNKILKIYKSKHWLTVLILFIILTLPIYLGAFWGAGSSRVSQVSVLNRDRGSKINIIQDIIHGYASEIDPANLFFHGDGNPRHSIEGFGKFYVWEALTLLVAIILSAKYPKFLVFFMTWVVVSIAPAAISVPNPHLLRTLNMLPVGVILSAFGLAVVSKFLCKSKLILRLIIVSLISFYLVKYLESYYFISPKYSSVAWADGYKQLYNKIELLRLPGEKVVVSGHNWQPYVYFLFYSKYDPRAYQSAGNSSSFGEYYFGPTGWDKNPSGEELGNINLKRLVNGSPALIALSPEEFSRHSELNKLSDVHDSNGRLVYILSRI